MRCAPVVVGLRTPPRLIAVLCALVALVAAVAGCGADVQSSGSSTPEPTTSVPNPYDAARRKGVEALLAQWGRAMRDDDVKALTALVDPHAAPGFLQKLQHSAQNLRGVPLSDFGYGLGAEDTPEVPVPPNVADRLDATDIWAPPVYLHFAFAGVDVAPTHRPVGLIVARHGDRWSLVSEDELGGAGPETWRGVWDFGPVVSDSVDVGGGRRSVVLGHPAQQAEVDRLAGELRSGIAAVTRFWGTDWSQRTVVIATGSDDEFAELAGNSREAPAVAATTISDHDGSGSAGDVTGQRVIFSPAAATQLTDLTRPIVLRHELTHVATRAKTVDGSPMWVLEGVPDYVGYRDSGLTLQESAPIVTDLVRRNGPPDALPSNDDFTGGHAELAYELARTAATYVATTKGPQTLRAMYVALARGPVSPAQQSSRLEQVLGMTTKQFVAAWGAWLSARVGH